MRRPEDPPLWPLLAALVALAAALLAALLMLKDAGGSERPAFGGVIADLRHLAKAN